MKATIALFENRVNFLTVWNQFNLFVWFGGNHIFHCQAVSGGSWVKLLGCQTFVE